MTIKVVKEIGRGSFGKVYEVSVGTGEVFAMKTLEPQDFVKHHIDAEALKKRFTREVKYQSAIDDPNVASIYEFDMDADPPYFLMELASGTLKDDLDADRTLGGNPSKALFDILSGLEAIHEQGIIHRDLKPQNVLKFTNQEGDGPSYKISDFGLITATQSDTTTLTVSGAGGGTVMYAAPELISNFKRATAAADIYSFGAILHDVFGGGASRVPYTELNVPGKIGDIVRKCTKSLAIRRYKDISSLREDLYQVLTQEVIVFASSQEQHIVEILNEERALTSQEWDTVFVLIEDNEDKDKSNSNIFKAIKRVHIDDLADTAPDLLAALGHEFSDYSRDNSFDFDYCDVLADKLELFFQHGDTSLRASTLISLLMLGANHNRWFVERKFQKLAGKDLSDAVANKIKIDCEVLNIEFKRYISHLEWSINMSPTSLHETLQELLN